MKHCFAILSIFFLSFATPAISDPDFTIAAIVHDVAGARLPQAHVKVRLSSSAAIIEGACDDKGEFHLQVNAPGSYQVEVTAEGFKPATEQVALTQDSPAAILDVALEVAGSTQTIEVTANALTAETTSTQLGESLDTQKIESAPLNGRSFTDLMAVQPGIVPASTAQPGAVIMTGVASTPPSGDANPGNLSISGQREASNGFRVNGSDVEEDVNMGTSIVPNLDSIDSFRVLTSNFDAEYGNSSGGQVLVVTKSGVRKFMARPSTFCAIRPSTRATTFPPSGPRTGKTSLAAHWAARLFTNLSCSSPTTREPG